MKLFRFIISNVFFKNLFYIIMLTLLISFIIFFGLAFVTEHNNYVKVPKLFGLNVSKAIETTKNKSLKIIIIDSAKFNPNHPPLTVLEQFPNHDMEVKKGRKIYLTLNPIGYKKMKVPNLIQITLRNAETLLNAVGFELGELIYKDNIGKDMVLEMRHEGKKIEPGHTLPQREKIDLVLGNGKK